MSETLTIRIGGVTISVDKEVAENRWEVMPSYRGFIASGRSDLRLRLHDGVSPIAVGEMVFDCSPIWTLYRKEGGSVVKIFETLPALRRTLVLSGDLETSDLYFGDSTEFRDPFYGPTLELLMVHFLARERGVILHSCAVSAKGKGILFVGESGAGKSTLARMWSQEKDAVVLSDDRTIVRKEEDGFRIYGTPWHGEARFGAPSSAKLDTLFFLRQDGANRIRQVEGIDPVSRLLACSFPPFWDPPGIAFTLEILTALSSGVSCHELSFKPERSALRLVQAETGT